MACFAYNAVYFGPNFVLAAGMITVASWLLFVACQAALYEDCYSASPIVCALMY